MSSARTGADILSIAGGRCIRGVVASATDGGPGSLYRVRMRWSLAGLIACVALSVGPGSAIAGTPAWTTYHHDAGRSGIDPDSTSPVSPRRVWQTSPPLDGLAWSQPLVYGSRVYVATENDTVYALDAATGAIVWQKHLATPVPAGQLPCGDITPVVGITSTPVIDPSTGRIFAVADTWNGSSAQHELFGLNLADGSPAPGLPTVVDPPGSTPLDQLQRVSLALDAGKVIIGYGGNSGDCGSYHGWLVAVPESGGSLQTFEVDPNTNQGAIWAAGNAPAIDSSGNIWTSTGNGSSSSFGYQESVIKLDPNLNVLDYWAPSNWSALDSSDTDLGSSMPLLLPGALVFQIGKAGVGYLLSASSLGGTGGPPLYQASVCSGSYGGGIYYTGVIYVACSNGVHAVSLNTTAHTFTPVSGWTVNSSATGPPIFAGGLVWSAGTGNGVLYGLDPRTGTTRFSANLGTFEHFTSPSAAGGRLFIANGDQVTAFQIATLGTSSPAVAKVAPAAGPAAGGTTVTITGSAFVPGATVKFGTTSATSVTYLSSTQLKAVAPAHAAGTVDVTVTTPGGTSGILAGDKYVYGPPMVSGLNPRSGPTTGNTTVTITGRGFVAGATVKFGTTAAASVTYLSSTTIKAVAPPHPAGTVDVRVTTPGGTSAIVASDKYTY